MTLLLPELCNVGLNWHYFLPLCFSRRWSWMGWLVCSRTGGSPQSDGARRDGTDGKSFKFWPQLAPEKRHFTNTQDTSPAPTFNNCDLPWFVCYLCISLENCFLLMAFLSSYPQGSINHAINHSVNNLELYLYAYYLKSCKLLSFTNFK